MVRDYSLFLLSHCDVCAKIHRNFTLWIPAAACKTVAVKQWPKSGTSAATTINYNYIIARDFDYLWQFEIFSEQCQGYLFIFVLQSSSIFHRRPGVCRVYPIQVVGNAMSQTWSDRHRILLVTRARQRLKNWGVSAGAMAAIALAWTPGIPHDRFDRTTSHQAIKPSIA